MNKLYDFRGNVEELKLDLHKMLKTKEFGVNRQGERHRKPLQEFGVLALVLCPMSYVLCPSDTLRERTRACLRLAESYDKRSQTQPRTREATLRSC